MALLYMLEIGAYAWRDLNNLLIDFSLTATFSVKRPRALRVIVNMSVQLRPDPQFNPRILLGFKRIAIAVPLVPSDQFDRVLSWMVCKGPSFRENNTRGTRIYATFTLYIPAVNGMWQ